MKRIAELQDQITDQMALLFERSGTSPLVGRIFALLLFCNEPLGLQEMAERLNVTKAAVSVQVRALEQHGLCYKLARTNDRRDYYQIRDDFGMTVIKEGTQNMLGFLRFLQNVMHEFPNSNEITPDEVATYQTTKRRFLEMKALHELFAERMQGFEAEWEKRRQQLFVKEGY